MRDSESGNEALHSHQQLTQQPQPQPHIAYPTASTAPAATCTVNDGPQRFGQVLGHLTPATAVLPNQCPPCACAGNDAGGDGSSGDSPMGQLPSMDASSFKDGGDTSAFMTSAERYKHPNIGVLPLLQSVAQLPPPMTVTEPRASSPGDVGQGVVSAAAGGGDSSALVIEVTGDGLSNTGRQGDGGGSCVDGAKMTAFHWGDYNLLHSCLVPKHYDLLHLQHHHHNHHHHNYYPRPQQTPQQEQQRQLHSSLKGPSHAHCSLHQRPWETDMCSGSPWVLEGAQCCGSVTCTQRDSCTPARSSTPALTPGLEGPQRDSGGHGGGAGGSLVGSPHSWSLLPPPPDMLRVPPHQSVSQPPQLLHMPLLTAAQRPHRRQHALHRLATLEPVREGSSDNCLPSVENPLSGGAQSYSLRQKPPLQRHHQQQSLQQLRQPAIGSSEGKGEGGSATRGGRRSSYCAQVAPTRLDAGDTSRRSGGGSSSERGIGDSGPHGTASGCDDGLALSSGASSDSQRGGNGGGSSGYNFDGSMSSSGSSAPSTGVLPATTFTRGLYGYPTPCRPQLPPLLQPPLPPLLPLSNQLLQPPQPPPNAPPSGRPRQRRSHRYNLYLGEGSAARRGKRCSAAAAAADSVGPSPTDTAAAVPMELDTLNAAMALPDDPMELTALNDNHQPSTPVADAPEAAPAARCSLGYGGENCVAVTAVDGFPPPLQAQMSLLRSPMVPEVALPLMMLTLPSAEWRRRRRRPLQAACDISAEEIYEPSGRCSGGPPSSKRCRCSCGTEDYTSAELPVTSPPSAAAESGALATYIQALSLASSPPLPPPLPAHRLTRQFPSLGAQTSVVVAAKSRVATLPTATPAWHRLVPGHWVGCHPLAVIGRSSPKCTRPVRGCISAAAPAGPPDAFNRVSSGGVNVNGGDEEDAMVVGAVVESWGLAPLGSRTRDEGHQTPHAQPPTLAEGTAAADLALLEQPEKGNAEYSHRGNDESLPSAAAATIASAAAAAPKTSSTVCSDLAAALMYRDTPPLQSEYGCMPQVLLLQATLQPEVVLQRLQPLPLPSLPTAEASSPNILLPSPPSSQDWQQREEASKEESTLTYTRLQQRWPRPCAPWKMSVDSDGGDVPPCPGDLPLAQLGPIPVTQILDSELLPSLAERRSDSIQPVGVRRRRTVTTAASSAVLTAPDVPAVAGLSSCGGGDSDLGDSRGGFPDSMD